MKVPFFRSPSFGKFLSGRKSSKEVPRAAELEFNELDLYALFDLPRNSSAAQIRKAYREQALIWHPDKAGNTAEVQLRFQYISDGYRVLSDQVQRARYDAKFPTAGTAYVPRPASALAQNGEDPRAGGQPGYALNEDSDATVCSPPSFSVKETSKWVPNLGNTDADKQHVLNVKSPPLTAAPALCTKEFFQQMTRKPDEAEWVWHGSDQPPRQHSGCVEDEEEWEPWPDAQHDIEEEYGQQDSYQNFRADDVPDPTEQIGQEQAFPPSGSCSSRTPIRFHASNTDLRAFSSFWHAGETWKPKEVCDVAWGRLAHGSQRLRLRFSADFIAQSSRHGSKSSPSLNLKEQPGQDAIRAAMMERMNVLTSSEVHASCHIHVNKSQVGILIVRFRFGLEGEADKLIDCFQRARRKPPTAPQRGAKSVDHASGNECSAM